MGGESSVMATGISRRCLDEFEAAVEEFKTIKFAKEVPIDRQLLLYKYLMQATEGDVVGSQPWSFQVAATSATILISLMLDRQSSLFSAGGPRDEPVN